MNNEEKNKIIKEYQAEQDKQFYTCLKWIIGALIFFALILFMLFCASGFAYFCEMLEGMK